MMKPAGGIIVPTETPDAESDEPRSPICDVIELNIVKLTNLRRKADRRRGLQGRVADAITDFSGSMLFVYFHVGWFGLWILANTGWFGFEPFDPFPYGLLTMIVSLEAIFLSAFVLISQNRLSAEANQRDDLDLQIGLLTEHELTHVLKMLDEIRQHLGIAQHDRELKQLEKEVRPEDVLAEIDRAQERLLGKKRLP
jgi:uncharacterized membrane protein